jgi:L-alanine-DL-glutamate epimerase-like enolase superfamily enzyme
MRIAAVTAIPIKIPETEFWGGGGAGALGPEQGSGDYVTQPGWLGLYSSKIETCLVRVETDVGLVGYGEGQTPVGPEVTAAAVEKVLRPILVGEDPMRVGVLRRRMYEALLFRGHFSGTIVDAIAGADSALWDLRGKMLDRPVSDLLGGAFRSRIPVYVSGLKGQTADEQISLAQDYIRRGFRAFKLFLTEGLQKDTARLRRIRGSLGPDVDLMIDVLWAYDLPAAIRMGSVCEELGVAWFEAPVHPQDLDGHAELTRTLRVPVAGGETDRTRYQFLEQFQRRAIRVAQPDIGRTGISEGKVIAELAETFNVPLTMHTGIASAVLIASSLQVASTIPTCWYQEYQPFVTEVANRFIKTPLRCDQGHFELPVGPGLGIEIDEVALRAYQV